MRVICRWRRDGAESAVLKYTTDDRSVRRCCLTRAYPCPCRGSGVSCWRSWRRCSRAGRRSGCSRRWRGRRVHEARWAYDGAAQGGKKIAFGNTWAVAALVVRLPFCPSPSALPVLFRLWAGKGTASQVELAAQMLKLLAGAFPGREVHGTGDAAFHGKSLVIKGATWTTRLPSNAVLYGPKPEPTGRRGRPAEKGARIGTCRDAAGHAAWRDTVIRAYGKEEKVQVTSCPALWHGSFGAAPGQLVLVRDPDSRKPYDLGIFTLDTEASPEAIAGRYSWRWAIEPSNATGKQLTGAGDACSRTPKAVERAVPFAFLVQSLMCLLYTHLTLPTIYSV